jgi:uncharacterized membrane protein YkvA (DUF1232 family)
MRRLLVLLWRVSRSDLRVLWLALRSPARPRWLLPAALFLGFYALAPFNFALPVLGVLDDFVLVPLALHWLVRLLPAHVAQPAFRPRR